MKQTAVEWFAKELNNWRIKEFGEDSIIGIPQEVFEQAKQMEKEQMIQIYKAAFMMVLMENYLSLNNTTTKPLNQNKMKVKERLLLFFAGIGAFELLKYLISLIKN